MTKQQLEELKRLCEERIAGPGGGTRLIKIRDSVPALIQHIEELEAENSNIRQRLGQVRIIVEGDKDTLTKLQDTVERLEMKLAPRQGVFDPLDQLYHERDQLRSENERYRKALKCAELHIDGSCDPFDTARNTIRAELKEGEK